MTGKTVLTAEELDDAALAHVNGGLMKSDPTMPASGTGGGGSTGGVAGGVSTAGAAVGSAVQSAFQSIGSAIGSVFHKP